MIVTTPRREISSMQIVFDDIPPLDVAAHHMVQGSGTVESCVPRYRLSPPVLFVLLLFGFVQQVDNLP